MFAIQKLLLWAQPEKILDAAVVSGKPQRAIILGAESVSILQLQNGSWQVEQSLPISHEQPWPRDLRGRLVLRNDHLFDAYLPEVFCQSTASSPFALKCTPNNAPWPLSPDDSTVGAFFANDQNFFTGTVTLDGSTQKSVPAFFSAALLFSPADPLWILSGVDGRLYMTDRSWAYKPVQIHAGSDVASIHSNCGTAWQLLIVGAEPSQEKSTPRGQAQDDNAVEALNQEGDKRLRDSLRAFEVVDQDFIPVSPSLNFNGTVNALWAHSKASSITAVVHNNTAGDYEAYQLTISCSR